MRAKDDQLRALISGAKAFRAPSADYFRSFAPARSTDAALIPERIFLVGFMGCGKTTVGRLIASKLLWTFVDLDAEIEERAGIPVSKIFQRHGEGRFRQIEFDALRQASKGATRVIVSLGGGAFVSEVNRSIVVRSGISVWLDVPLRVVTKRVARQGQNRPLARSPEQLNRLYRARLPFYHEADIRVRAGDQPADRVARAVVRLVREDWVVIAERRRLHL